MAFDHLIKKGSTGQIIEVTIRDGSTGQGMVGIATGSVTFSYFRRGASAASTVTVQAMTKGTWTNAGWVEVDATNRPGEYQFGVPDAALAAGSDGVTLRFKIAGAIDKEVKIVLIAADLQVANIPANVIQISGTNAVVSNGFLSVNVASWGGVSSSITVTGGLPNVNTSAIGSTPVAFIWNAATSGLSVAGSIGKLLVDNIDARISSVSGGGLTAAQVWAFATRALTDRSGFVLDPSQGFNNTGQTQAYPANVKFWQDHIPATNINDAENAAYPRVIVADIENAGAWSIWTYAGRSLTDRTGFSLADGSIDSSTFAAGAINSAVAPNLDAPISSRMATFTPVTAYDVWNYSARALTDKSANVVSWKGQTVADPVLGSGALPVVYMSNFDASAGQGLANTVWRTLTASITTAGSFGDLLNTNLDTAVSSRMAAASYVAPDNAGIAAIQTQADKLAFLDHGDGTWDVRVPAISSLTAAEVWNYGTRSLSNWDSFRLNATDLQNIAQYVWAQETASIGAGIGQFLTANLDARVSSRLAATAYVLPDNAGIGAIRAQGDKLVFLDHGDGTFDVRTGSVASVALDYAAIAAAVWSSATRSLTDKLGFALADGSISTSTFTAGAISVAVAPNLDAPVSSRMASFAYVAPDNAGIAAIQAKTDQLAFIGGDVVATLSGEVVSAGVDNTSIAAAVWAAANRTITGGSLDLVGSVTNPVATTDAAAIASIKIATDKIAFVSHGDGTWDVRVPVPVTLSAADVWGYVSRSLTDKAGFFLANGSISSATFALGAITPAVAPNLDATISSRMASFVYVVPDNAGIAAIRVHAEKMFFLPHGDGSYDLRSTATIDNDAIADSVWASGSRTLTMAVTDWTDMERGQIRHALGITGATASTNGEGLLDDVHFQAMKLQFNSESDVIVSLAGETVHLNPMQNFNNIGQADEVPAKDAMLRGLLTAERVGRLAYLDTPISTRSSHTPTDVWSFNDRTMTSFGTLVSDIAAAVWTFGSRTLTGFGSLVGEIWSAAVRTVTGGVMDLSAQARVDVRSAADAALVAYDGLTHSDAAFDRDQIIGHIENLLAAVNVKPDADAIAVAVDLLLSANHGEGSWIDASKGSGPITYTVSVTDGSNPIAFASVRLSVGPLGLSQTTDAQGKAIFDVQPGTYKVQIAKLGYTDHNTTVMVGEAPAQQGFTAIITPLAVITFPPDPDKCTAFLTTYDAVGNVQSGVDIEIRLVSPPPGNAQSFSAKPWTVASDAQGLVQVPLLKNAAYQARRGSGEWHLLKTDNRDSIPMPTVLSHPSK